MNILILEDAIDMANNYKKILEEHLNYKCIIVDNIIDFDYHLYERKNIEFDYFIVDLHLNLPPNISQKDLNEWLLEKGIEKKTFITGNISIIGLDYFISRVAKHETTKDKLDKFMLVSGYKDMIIKSIDKEILNQINNFLGKNESDLLNKIISIIESKLII